MRGRKREKTARERWLKSSILEPWFPWVSFIHLRGRISEQAIHSFFATRIQKRWDEWHGTKSQFEGNRIGEEKNHLSPFMPSFSYLQITGLRCCVSQKVTPCLSKENACVSYGGSRVDSRSVNWVRFYRGNVFETELTFLATSSLRSHSLTRLTQTKKLRQGFPD